MTGIVLLVLMPCEVGIVGKSATVSSSNTINKVGCTIGAQ